MKKLIVLFILVLLFNCGQDKIPILGETEFQKELNTFYKDASKSPLKKKDLKNFKGLDFYKFDSAYVVKAKFTRTPNEKPFKMRTTTDRLPNYVKYGIIEFELEGKMHLLNIYQNLDIIDEEDYEDYLFLPFLDNTNGEGSYAGGRYIDSSIPIDDYILIDFNTAYNPYCAYNEKYSCPIVPRENYVDAYVKAGVKTFNKH